MNRENKFKISTILLIATLTNASLPLTHCRGDDNFDFNASYVANQLSRSHNASEAQRRLFIQMNLYNARTQEPGEVITIARDVAALLRTTPNAEPTSVQSAANSIRDQFREYKARANGIVGSNQSLVLDSITTILDSTRNLNHPEIKLYSEMARTGINLYRLGRQGWEEASRSYNQNHNQALLASYSQIPTADLERAFGEVYDAAQLSPRAHQGVQLALGINPTVDFSEFLNQHTEFRENALMNEVFRLIKDTHDQQNHQVSATQLQEGLQHVTNAIAARMHEQNGELQRLNQRLEEIGQSVSDVQKQQARAEAESEAAQRRAALAEEYQAVLTGSRAAVFILASFAGLDNPRLANQINIVGNAAVTIYDSFHAITSLSNSGASGLMEGMTSLAATGNMLGAAMSIASLFGPQQESAMAQISRQLQSIEQELNTMRREMHARFDIIDTKLDGIHHDLINGLNLLLSGQRLTQDQLSDLNFRLNGALDNTYRLERNMRSFWEAYFAFDEQINRGRYLEFGDYGTFTTGSRNKFTEGLTYFHALASSHATDSISQLDFQPQDLTPAGAATRFHAQGGSVFSNLNYLRHYAIFLHNSGSSSNSPQPTPFDRFGTLASPLGWARAADAFMELMTKVDDGFLSQLSESDRSTIGVYINDLLTVGASLKGFTSELARADSTSHSTNGIPRYLDKLLTEYEQAIVPMEGALLREQQTYEQRYLRGFSLNPVERGAPRLENAAEKNLFHEYQAPEAIPPCTGVKDLVSGSLMDRYILESWEELEAGAPAMTYQLSPAPSNFLDLIPNSVMEAHQLGLGTISTCYRYEWIHRRLQDWSGQACISAGLFGGCDNAADLRSTQHWGNLKITIDVNYTAQRQPIPLAHANSVQVQNAQQLRELPENQRTTKLVFSRSVTTTDEWNYREIYTSSEHPHRYMKQSLIADFNKFLEDQWTRNSHIENQFALHSEEVLTVANVQVLDQASVANDVTTLRQNVRQQLHRQVSQALGSQALPQENSNAWETIRAGAQHLTGYKDLLTAYISLVLPVSLQRNEQLRSLLYGEDQLMDEARLLESFAQISDHTVESIGLKHRGALSRLRGLLTQLLANHQMQEQTPLIDTTISRLALALRLLPPSMNRATIGDAYQNAKTRINQLLQNNRNAVR